MDRKQITAIIAGAALIGASLFGAVAVAQGDSDVTVSENPQAPAASAIVYETGAVDTTAPVITNSAATAYADEPADSEEYEEYDTEEHEEYDTEEHEEEEHGDTEDHDEYEEDDDDHEEYDEDEDDD